MNRLWTTLREKWPDYLLEMLVIIIGIIVSLMLNEWRLQEQAERQNAQVLDDIRTDLAADTVALHHFIDLTDSMIEVNRLLLHATPGTLPDSLIAPYLDMVSSYVAFPIRDVGFSKLRELGLDMKKKPELLSEIILQYTYFFPLMEEWNEVDKHFILERFIPYLEETAPYFPTDDEAYIFGQQAFYEVAARDRFQNLLRLNINFKRNQRMVMEMNLEHIREVLVAMEE